MRSMSKIAIINLKGGVGKSKACEQYLELAQRIVKRVEG